MRLGVGLAVALAMASAPVASAAESGAPAPVSFARMAARIPAGTTWATLQAVSGPFGCHDVKELTWSAKNNEDAGGPEFERTFREEFAAAGLQVTGDPNNLFQRDDRSADIQVGALITGLSARFCANQTFKESLAGSEHFEMKGEATMAIEWQVYSTSQAKVLARIPTTGAHRIEKAVDAGDGVLLQRAFAANVRALAASPAFRTAITGSAQAASMPPHERAAIALAAAPDGARPIKDAAASVATVFAGGAMGSAFLISTDGYLLTNQHVVGDAAQVRLRWADKSESVGRVIRSDRRRDVALIQADPKGRTPLALRRSSVDLGETVFAVGTPLEKDFENTVTKGVVSANRLLEGQAFVQSDVAVDHGNSGGPLLDEKGRVIAITDWGYAPDGVSHNLNFFIPIGDALKALALTPAPEAAPPAKAAAAKPLKPRG
jgi:S1-C subfamily serine protease